MSECMYKYVCVKKSYTYIGILQLQWLSIEWLLNKTFKIINIFIFHLAFYLIFNKKWNAFTLNMLKFNLFSFVLFSSYLKVNLFSTHSLWIIFISSPSSGTEKITNFSGQRLFWWKCGCHPLKFKLYENTLFWEEICPILQDHCDQKSRQKFPEPNVLEWKMTSTVSWN